MNHKEPQLRNDGKNRSILPVGRNIPVAELKKSAPEPSPPPPPKAKSR
jgi:hypothetical protein